MPSHVKMVSETSSIFMALQAPVRSVTARLVAGVLASAERHCGRLFGLELDRAEAAALVRAIAEGLVAALATGTPPIGFAGFHIDPVWALLCDDRLRA